jgi:adenylate cyclase
LLQGIRHFGLLQGIELAAYDHFTRLQPNQSPDKRLLVVGISETDLQTLQEWPISDRTIAKLLKKLNANQPRVIGLDILRDIPVMPGRTELLNQLAASKHTLLVCKVSSVDELGTPPPPEVSADQVGFADLVIDSGGILRRSLLMMSPPPLTGLSRIKPTRHLCNDPANTLTSLSFHAALLYLQQQKIEPDMTKSAELKIGSILFSPFYTNMGGYRGADAGGYQILLRYRSANNAAPQVSLMDVLSNRVPASMIRDRMVLIGYATPLAKDDFYTPFSANKNDRQKMPGVMVHAQSASQILSAVLDQRSLIWVWPSGIEAVWIFGWSLLGGIIAGYLRHPLWLTAIMAALIGVIYGISLLLFVRGGWIPFVPAIAAFVSTGVGVVLFDRFNNSIYGQTVYQKMKTFLKLEIHIDEQKVEKQVSEIIESDYFRDLQNTVKDLREKQPALNKDINEDIKISFPHQASLVNNIEDVYPSSLEVSPVDIKNTILSQSSSSDENILQDTTENDEYEIDYLQQLTQESKSLKLDLTSYSGQNENPSLKIYQEFTLDDQLTKAEETDQEIDYLSHLMQESQRLKSIKKEQQ